MTRFIKQRDTYSCGTIALMNALKWAGRKSGLSRMTFKYWKSFCKTRKDTGTFKENLFRAFRKCLDLKVYSRKRITLENLDQVIDAGRVVVMASTVPNGWHWMLIISRTNKTYRVVNYHIGPTVQHIRRQEINDSMQKARANRKYFYPYAIIISKQNKGN